VYGSELFSKLLQAFHEMDGRVLSTAYAISLRTIHRASRPAIRPVMGTARINPMLL